MAKRQVYSGKERLCIEELILKYNLHNPTFCNPALKKAAWGQLTEEFNSISTNTSRSESQLRKCWDNMKTRRKQIAQEIERRELMEIRERGDDTLKIRFSQSNDKLSTSDSLSHEHLSSFDPIVFRNEVKIERTEEEIEVEPIIEHNNEESLRNRRSGSCKSEFEIDQNHSQDSSQHSVTSEAGYRLRQTRSEVRNIRSKVINEEFELRRENYRISQKRNEELHKLKIAEQEWLTKAAEEKYHKARLERELAELLLAREKNKKNDHCC